MPKRSVAIDHFQPVFPLSTGLGPGMEMPSEFKGHFVSVLSLMRDGGELATRLREVQARALDDPRLLRSVIDPYVEIVAPGLQCAQTGLQLSDIWRYFRHTWSNQYTTTPGRTMALLVRDRAAPYHPIIGIGALASSIVHPRSSWSNASMASRSRPGPAALLVPWISFAARRRYTS